MTTKRAVEAIIRRAAKKQRKWEKVEMRMLGKNRLCIRTMGVVRGGFYIHGICPLEVVFGRHYFQKSEKAYGPYVTDMILGAADNLTNHDQTVRSKMLKAFGL